MPDYFLSSNKRIDLKSSKKFEIFDIRKSLLQFFRFSAFAGEKFESKAQNLLSFNLKLD